MLVLAFSACQTPSENNQGNDSVMNNTVVAAPCDFTPIDSVSAQKQLKGEWELAGVKPNRMMADQPDEFLTGEQIGTPRGLIFYDNNEFEQTLNGQKQRERQKYVLQDEGLSPLAYQFWFCGDNTLILSNVAADGPTEVYIRK